MGTSRAQQFEAIGLGAGVGQFVAEDDAGGIILETAQRYITLSLGDHLIIGAFEFLGIAVDRGLGVLAENAALSPIVKACRRTGVDIFVRIVSGLSPAQNDANQVG